MSTGYDCILSVHVIVLPEDREHVERGLLDIVRQVFAEHGVDRTLPDSLESHNTREGETQYGTQCLWLLLEMQGIHIDPPWKADGNKLLQRWCDTIETKARELPVKRVAASADGDRVDSSPDISGYAAWNSEQEEQMENEGQK